jgi:hypothetical protein
MTVHCMQVDASYWPLVVATFDGQQTDEDLEYYIARMDEVHARRQPFVALTVARSYANSFAHVRRLGAWAKATASIQKEFCKGGAIVVPSSSGRFLISSFLLIYVPPFPMVVLEDMRTAVPWVKQRLVEANMLVPPSIAKLELVASGR